MTDTTQVQLDALRTRVEQLEHFASQATLLINTLIEVRFPKKQGETIHLSEEARKIFEAVQTVSKI